jgi:hypothetical protein
MASGDEWNDSRPLTPAFLVEPFCCRDIENVQESIKLDFGMRQKKKRRLGSRSEERTADELGLSTVEVKLKETRAGNLPSEPHPSE